VATTLESYHQASATMRKVLYEIKRVIVGQDVMLERVLVALLAAVAMAIRGTLHELERTATPRIVAPRPILRTPAPNLAA